MEKKFWIGMITWWSYQVRRVCLPPPLSLQGDGNNFITWYVLKFNWLALIIMQRLCYFYVCFLWPSSHTSVRLLSATILYTSLYIFHNLIDLRSSYSLCFRLLASPVHISVGGLSFEEASSISTEHVTRYEIEIIRHLPYRIRDRLRYFHVVRLVDD